MRSARKEDAKMGLKKRIFLKSDGRLTVPKEFRDTLGLEDGSVLEAEIYGNDKILLTVLRR